MYSKCRVDKSLTTCEIFEIYAELNQTFFTSPTQSDLFIRTRQKSSKCPSRNFGSGSVWVGAYLIFKIGADSETVILAGFWCTGFAYLIPKFAKFPECCRRRRLRAIRLQFHYFSNLVTAFQTSVQPFHCCFFSPHFISCLLAQYILAIINIKWIINAVGKQNVMSSSEAHGNSPKKKRKNHSSLNCGALFVSKQKQNY